MRATVHNGQRYPPTAVALTWELWSFGTLAGDNPYATDFEYQGPVRIRLKADPSRPP